MKNQNRRIINWILKKNPLKIPLLIMFHCSKLDANWWYFRIPFVCWKQLKQWFFLFQTSSFIIKCAPFLFKIEEDFSIDDFLFKSLEIGRILFNEHICFKCVFDLENYEFWKCVFNKSYSFLCYLKCECTIYKWYRPRCGKR